VLHALRQAERVHQGHAVLDRAFEGAAHVAGLGEVSCGDIAATVGLGFATIS